MGKEKNIFQNSLVEFVGTLQNHISGKDGQWSIKGFIDTYKNIYTISADTKIVSKILEIHIFPQIMKFAKNHGYKIVLPDHQNYYPDISFIRNDNENIKFAIDIKTTYRNPKEPRLCNGFTLGSHGKYFEDRQSTKNIQFPYSSYCGHFCIGIIYDRVGAEYINETKVHDINNLQSIASVIESFRLFVAEKWKIASDKSGSGNTANIGSINNIEDIVNGNGMFSKLGESWFDEYWMNYRKISVPDPRGGVRKISSLEDFVKYKNGDTSLIVARNNKRETKS